MNSNNRITFTFVSEKIKTLSNIKLNKQQIKAGTCSVIATLMLLNNAGSISAQTETRDQIETEMCNDFVEMIDKAVDIAEEEEIMAELLSYSSEPIEMDSKTTEENSYTIRFTSVNDQTYTFDNDMLKRLMADPEIDAIMKINKLTELQLAFIIASILDNNVQFTLNNINNLVDDQRFIHEIEAGLDEPTLEEKLNFIYKKYGVTEDQFKKIVCTFLVEAGPINYKEGYNVSSTPLNRMHSITWSRDVAKIFGEEKKQNLYYTVICPGQFIAYETGGYHDYYDESGIYHEYYGSTNPEYTYMGIVDCFYYGVPSHDYTAFRSYHAGWEQLSPKGNYYGMIMPESDYLEVPEVEESIMDETLTNYSTIKQYTITYR